MKIIVFLLLTVTSTYAQNIEYIKSLNAMDSLVAAKFAQNIIDNTGKSYEFSRTYLNVAKDVCNYLYKPKGFKGFCDEYCITISFDFNKKGVYYFSSIDAKLEDLLPTWKKLFYSNATMELVNNFDYKSTHFKNKENQLNYYLYPNEYQAKIKNSSW